jgi:LysM repeat protein
LGNSKTALTFSESPLKFLLPFALITSICSLSAQMPAPDPVFAPAPKADVEGRPYHLIQEGDTLTGIANSYGIAISKLVELNNLRNNTIVVGDRLYLAPAGAKISLPSQGESTGSASETGQPGAVASARGPQDPPNSEYVDSGPQGLQQQPQIQPQVGIVLNNAGNQNHSSPRLSSPKAPGGRPNAGLIINPDSGLSEPSTAAFRRKPISGTIPDAIPLSQVLAGLPLLDDGLSRTEWTASQERIATWWERQIVHTQGFPRSSQWILDTNGARLILRISPSASFAPFVQVLVPGSLLPEEIDGASLKRMISMGAPFRVLGHLIYLDGPGPISLLRSGELLSPWGIVAEKIQVHAPASGWVTLTRESPAVASSQPVPSPVPANPAVPASSPTPAPAPAPTHS